MNQKIQNRLYLMADMVQAVIQIKTEILDLAATDELDDALFDVLDEIQDGELTDKAEIKRIVGELLPRQATSEAVEEQATPYMKYTAPYAMEYGIEYPDKTKLCGFVGESDYGTYQTGSCLRNEDGCVTDLALAEIKKGELAEISGLPENNKDVDIYVWGNSEDEDYTHKITVQQRRKD